MNVGREKWIGIFTESVLQAAARASELADEIDILREEWNRLIIDQRTAEGRTRALRSDSAVTVILDDLPGTPVLTSATVARIHDVSPQAAATALESLRKAEVLGTSTTGNGRRVHVSTDILRLLESAGRGRSGNPSY